MLNSSSSTPPSIKVAHRAAKRRAIRRRRIDIDCGCSFFRHINCANHGFTHRGIHHCASSREWRVYLGDNKSPVFQNNQGGRPPIHERQSVPHPDPVQPQLEEGAGSSQSLLELPGLDDISDSFWDDIFK
ncbi:transcriptional activator protein [Tomato vein clearing leaf deformation virus]|uniref:Transcriptional activator protein n=1 Tax=Tomato vein clearing leaf deformation virus TaxID=2603436 RepID=A0A5B9G8P5_9GEMI|nr:transcriptional activator protein [Tomato vein clearing leaf deformation virus]QEE82322.1 transcriptional activator protein [Tomato vein clearing leaf deformation virus]